LLPGSVGGGPAGPEERAPLAREAGTVRSRLSSLQQGVRAGRTRAEDGSEGSPGAAEDPAADDAVDERDVAGGRQG
ncbi:MAG: hypothetical protein ACFCVG_08135, partial [Kineosporiaceae bacterium]